MGEREGFTLVEGFLRRLVRRSNLRGIMHLDIRHGELILEGKGGGVREMDGMKYKKRGRSGR